MLLLLSSKSRRQRSLQMDGKYNLLAKLLSDNSHMPIRVAIFSGKTKADNMYSVREFGNQCLLYSLDEVLRYGDVLNIIQADETDRVVERKEVPLFENDAFREAVINAFVHNLWVSGNEPMLTVFSDRIEILSRGTLALGQTMEGFFAGESIPVNKKLSEIFLQLHISEKTGRGVPIATQRYGRNAYEFRKNSIVVTIPFNWINVMGDMVGNKEGNKGGNKNHEYGLNQTQVRILAEIRNNPNITKARLMELLGLGKTTLDRGISVLKKYGYIERGGSRKAGYWKGHDPFKEYIRESEPDKRDKGYAWYTAIGLQAVDGLKTSEYLMHTAVRNIEGEISFKEANELLQTYYEENPAHDVKDRIEEADKVSVRIAEFLFEQAFSFTPNEYISIHRKLFTGIYSHAGRIRDYNITKKEWVLDGETVIYGSATELRPTLDYDFSEEKNFSYRNLSMDEIIHHLALFVSRLWQIHVFGEGNTRTTAVFFIKYLRTLGFDVTNDIFAENVWYFRNALVRANYNDLKNGIHETTEYLEPFLRNLLLNEHHLLHNRTLHIGGTFKEKPDIEMAKPDIEG